MRKSSRGLSPVRWLAVGLLACLALWIGSSAVDALALQRLGPRLGKASSERFPQEFFQRRITPGATPQEICASLPGSPLLHYYLGEDQTVVQLISYPLAIRRLEITVLYRKSRVFDVYSDEQPSLSGYRALTPRQVRSWFEHSGGIDAVSARCIPNAPE
jgi:hypothetical protein